MACEVKKCSKCKEEKTLDCFYLKVKENRWSSWCRACLYQTQTDRWIDRKKKAIELMGGKCCECGYNKNYAALEFHHLDPIQKEYEWVKLRLRNWDNIIKELKKCILLCKNCHVEIHNPNSVLSASNNSDNNSLNGKVNSNNPKGKVNSTGNCLVCQVEIFGTIYCSRECARYARRKVERPTCDELKTLLAENGNICAIARQYGVSDNAVRKWMKSCSIV